MLTLLLRRQMVVHLLANEACIDVGLGEFPRFSGESHLKFDQRYASGLAMRPSIAEAATVAGDAR